MLVRTKETMEAQGRLVSINQGKSSAFRMLNASDGMGFSLSEARGQPGGEANLWYKNHWEANYVRQGTGTLTNRTTGETWKLEPGVLYCVGPTDKHHIHNTGGEGMRIISVFNPPLSGKESHDADGSYTPGATAAPKGQPAMFVKTWAMAEAAGHARERAGGASRFAKLLTSAEGLGFALSDVRFQAGREADLWYRNHWEANIVLAGTVEITDATSGKVHTVGADGVYCVGPDDKHHLKAVTDVHLLSIFNPPLAGTEVHDADGAYPPTGDIPAGPSEKS